MQEIYKPAKGYKNYVVSSYGNVKHINEEDIVQVLNIHGYKYVNISNNGIKFQYLVHRLVSDTFIPNPENKQCVDHIDRVRTNNRVENLRWATHRENCFNRSTKNKSGYTGVHCIPNGKWKANLSINGKTYTKTFKTIEEAIEYRTELEKLHFGIYAAQPIININITNNIQTLNTLNQGGQVK
jgi:HNH endonuclease/NUMOD4 motif